MFSSSWLCVPTVPCTPENIAVLIVFNILGIAWLMWKLYRECSPLVHPVRTLIQAFPLVVWAVVAVDLSGHAMFRRWAIQGSNPFTGWSSSALWHVELAEWGWMFVALAFGGLALWLASSDKRS